MYLVTSTHMSRQWILYFFDVRTSKKINKLQLSILPFFCPGFPAEPPWHDSVIEIAFSPGCLLASWIYKNVSFSVRSVFTFDVSKTALLFFSCVIPRDNSLTGTGRRTSIRGPKAENCCCLAFSHAQTVVNTPGVDEMEGYTCVRQVLWVYYALQVTPLAAAQVVSAL